MMEAQRNLSEPQKDPLYNEIDKLEEHKNLNSQYTAHHALRMKFVEEVEGGIMTSTPVS
jgi:hypothetical protein